MRLTKLPAHILLGLALSTTAAIAQCPDEPTLQHWTGGGNATCPCFAAGEEAGAIFSAPAAHYPIEILRVGFGWGSQFGGSPDKLEQAIKIYSGSLPNPGVAQYSLAGPVLSDGFINEFDLQLYPGNRIINSGPFTVTLEFANANAGQFFEPSMVNDANGCQSGKNVVKAIPGGWSDACALGVTGDWQVHVIYRQVNCGSGTIGTNYCLPAVPNSSGSAAGMLATGTELVADNDVTLEAVNLPPSQFGYFLTSQTPYFLAGPGSSQGNLCLGGNLGRYNALSDIRFSSATGEFSLQLDLTDMPTNPHQAVFVGQTWNFQAWFRDQNPSSTSNFTDGLAITFQ
ncbi:MAG: hypothetical protein ACI87O_001582 [Planctomycetota bacterium]|jgi:hypothetical protein